MENKYVSTMDKEFVYLVKEFPTLSDSFYEIQRRYPEIYDVIKKYEPIIGYMPLVIQKEMVNGIMKQIEINELDNLFKNFNFEEVVNNEKRALKHYLRKNSNRLFTGLGCLKAIGLKLYSQNQDDKELIGAIYDNIKDIINFQMKMNIYEDEFIDKMYRMFIKKREDFVNNNTDNIISTTINNELRYVGYKYDQITDIINTVRKFSIEKQTYFKLVYGSVLRALNIISQFQGCKSNNKKPNVNEDQYSEYGIQYKDKTIIGIKQNIMKTQNNYIINQDILIQHKEDEDHYGVLDEAIPYIKKAISYCNSNQELSNKMKELLKGSPYLPFAYLDEIYEQEADCISCEGTDVKENYTYCTFKYNDEITVFDFVVANRTSKKKLMSYGKIFAEKMQACFSIFISGGKDYKEFCRGLMNQQCGNELDYHCKQSGLYDYLVENPISIPIPKEPKYSDEERNKKYLEWINNILIKGTLTLNPSSLLSYMLHEQRYNEVGSFTLNEFYKNIPIDNFISETQTKFDEDITIENINIAETEYRHVLDRSYIQIVELSLYIKYKYIFILTLFVLIL